MASLAGCFCIPCRVCRLSIETADVCQICVPCLWLSCPFADVREICVPRLCLLFWVDDCSFTALVAESYNRAYMAMITVQQLAEMEEIIDFRRQVGTALR